MKVVAISDTILRVTWSAVNASVDYYHVSCLVGCSHSFNVSSNSTSLPIGNVTSGTVCTIGVASCARHGCSEYRNASNNTCKLPDNVSDLVYWWLWFHSNPNLGCCRISGEWTHRAASTNVWRGTGWCTECRYCQVLVVKVIKKLVVPNRPFCWSAGLYMIFYMVIHFCGSCWAVRHVTKVDHINLLFSVSALDGRYMK